MANHKNDNKKMRADVFYILGSVYDALGNYPGALSYELDALKLFQDIGDKGGQAKSLNQIGILYNRSGDYHQELATYRQVLHLCRETNNKTGKPLPLIIWLWLTCL